MDKIKNFNELLIIQQGGRAGVDIPAMKRALQTAIKNDIDGVFKILWQENKMLKNNIFNDLNEEKAFELFETMLDDKSSDLYKIIKTTTNN